MILYIEIAIWSLRGDRFTLCFLEDVNFHTKGKRNFLSNSLEDVRASQKNRIKQTAPCNQTTCVYLSDVIVCFIFGFIVEKVSSTFIAFYLFHYHANFAYQMRFIPVQPTNDYRFLFDLCYQCLFHDVI